MRVTAKMLNEPTIHLSLNLSMDEARDLLALTHKCGGSPDTSTRGLMDDISKALTYQGVAKSTDRVHVTTIISFGPYNY